MMQITRARGGYSISFLVGGIVLLVFFATPGTEGDNRFGPPVTTACQLVLLTRSFS